MLDHASVVLLETSWPAEASSGDLFEDLKWVSLLMWAGADPRSIGPAWGDEEGLDESEYSSALLPAAYSKNVEILKRLKPDAKKDNLDHLLTSAAAFGRVDVVRYYDCLPNAVVQRFK